VTWAKEYAETLIAGLSASGCDVIGDLAELRPRPSAGPAASPSAQPAEVMLSAAVDAAAALVASQYRKQFPAKPRPAGGPGGVAGRLESAVARSPGVKRAVRELSSRYPAVRKLRVLAWRAMERARARERR